VSDLANPMTAMPHIAVTPPAIAQRQSADWGLVQPEQVEVIRHECFDYEFKGSRHLLIASERAERHDGETLVEGLPRSNRREWNRRMTFIPAGHRFYGWQKPRALLRSTFLYIDPLSPLLSELRFAEIDFPPRCQSIRGPDHSNLGGHRVGARAASDICALIPQWAGR